MNEFDTIKRSPLLYVTDMLKEEMNKIDIKREQEIEKIDVYYGRMIGDMQQFEQKCRDHYERRSDATTTANANDDFLDVVRNDLLKNETFLNTDQIIGDTELAKILHEIEALNRRLVQQLDDCKLSFTFDTHCIFQPDTCVDINE